jgi:hypothetical protein
MSVERGRELYRERHGQKPAHNPEADLAAPSTGVSWGRVLWRAAHGDEAAAAEVRRRAARGNATAQHVADSPGTTGPQIGQGSVPGSFGIDDVG